MVLAFAIKLGTFSLLNPSILFALFFLYLCPSLGTWLLFSLSRFPYAQCMRVPPRLAYRAQASPSHEPLLSKLGVQLGDPFSMESGFMVGRHRFTSHEGVTLSRGWLCSY